MLIWLVLLLMWVAYAILVICLRLIKNENSGDLTKMVTVLFASIWGISATLVILFFIFAKPVEIPHRVFPLESFERFGNGYAYSYYNEDKVLEGGFIEYETAGEFEFYEEEPFIEIVTEPDRRQFWFLYDNISDAETNYVFHVICENDIGTKQNSGQ